MCPVSVCPLPPPRSSLTHLIPTVIPEAPGFPEGTRCILKNEPAPGVVGRQLRRIFFLKNSKRIELLLFLDPGHVSLKAQGPSMSSLPAPAGVVVIHSLEDHVSCLV